MFRKLALSLGLISQLTLPASAELGVGSFPMRDALSQSSPVETVQFFWGGQRYCWYDFGWQGPGWYRCGFAWRTGFGWGGPVGWHGWRRPVVRHRPRAPVHRPVRSRAHRPAHNRPGPRQRPAGARPSGNRAGQNRGGGQRPHGQRPRGQRRSEAFPAIAFVWPTQGWPEAGIWRVEAELH